MKYFINSKSFFEVSFSNWLTKALPWVLSTTLLCWVNLLAFNLIFLSTSVNLETFSLLEFGDISTEVISLVALLSGVFLVVLSSALVEIFHNDAKFSSFLLKVFVNRMRYLVQVVMLLFGLLQVWTAEQLSKLFFGLFLFSLKNVHAYTSLRSDGCFSDTLGDFTLAELFMVIASFFLVLNFLLSLIVQAKYFLLLLYIIFPWGISSLALAESGILLCMPIGGGVVVKEVLETLPKWKPHSLLTSQPASKVYGNFALGLPDELATQAKERVAQVDVVVRDFYKQNSKFNIGLFLADLYEKFPPSVFQTKEMELMPFDEQLAFIKVMEIFSVHAKVEGISWYNKDECFVFIKNDPAHLHNKIYGSLNTYQNSCRELLSMKVFTGAEGYNSTNYYVGRPVGLFSEYASNTDFVVLNKETGVVNQYDKKYLYFISQGSVNKIAINSEMSPVKVSLGKQNFPVTKLTFCSNHLTVPHLNDTGSRVITLRSFNASIEDLD